MFRASITLFSRQLTGWVSNSLLIPPHMDKKAFQTERWNCQTAGEGNEAWGTKRSSIWGRKFCLLLARSCSRGEESARPEQAAGLELTLGFGGCWAEIPPWRVGMEFPEMDSLDPWPGWMGTALGAAWHSEGVPGVAGDDLWALFHPEAPPASGTAAQDGFCSTICVQAQPRPDQSCLQG